MFRVLITSFFIVISATVFSQENYPSTPDIMYGQLFVEVQMKHIFPDNKTFVDCIAKREPKLIVQDFYKEKKDSSFDLKTFVLNNFDLPPSPPVLNYIRQEKDVSAHIKNLWSTLMRDADQPNPYSSLLPLPNPYIVPGGRFREIYYWDSYFTMLGLKECGDKETIQHMVDNFAYLIRTYGHIPNGNRSYYLSRSQPPFFALMVELLAQLKGKQIYCNYLTELEHEYGYWMEGASSILPGESYKRVVRMKDGTYLNRYWDDNETPRQESFADDVKTAEKAVSEFISTRRFASEADLNRNSDSIRRRTYRNLRAAACSGWDFSNRWFADGEHIQTIETTDILPVDLNALMLKLQEVIVMARKVCGVKNADGGFYSRGNTEKYFWNTKQHFYTDYHFAKDMKQDKITLAGMFPLCFKTAELKHQQTKANQMSAVIKSKLLKDGGLVSVEKNSAQQWDAPNGWAPLQWMTTWGLDRCGQKALAKDIASRWVKLNSDVYLRTGKLMEKYNVENLSLEAGGGEYPGQDGFGWTNGVLLAMKKKYALGEIKYFK
jgi:alpha,alpha-trehalase